MKKTLLLVSFAISFVTLSAQNPHGVLSDSEKDLYEFQLVGDATAADPTQTNRRPPSECSGTRGWISYSLTHQLTQDPSLLAACELITGKRGICGTMAELVQGTGYYLDCPTGVWDMVYSPSGMMYQIQVNQEKGEIYVAEVQQSDEAVIEVHKYIPTSLYRWFEEDQEAYEKPTGRARNRAENAPKFCGEIPADPTFPPTATIIYSASDSNPLTVTFDGNTSKDNDENGNSINGYGWSFGDGETSGRAEVTHTFPRPGTYEVVLTVTDDEGETDDDIKSITVPMASQPPVAVIIANPPTGQAPLTVSFDGTSSTDQDENGEFIESYQWELGEEPFSSSEMFTHTFAEPGTYEIYLTVYDNENEKHTVMQTVTAFAPPPPPENCWTTIYTIRNCDGIIDTIGQTPIQVACPGPPTPTIVNAPCCCGDEIVDSTKKKVSPLQLAGGVVFQRFRGQLTEYGMGMDLQIRYRLGERQRFAVLVDVQVYPRKKGTPADDRPHKWSPLHDQIDPNTGLPLVWHRGSARGTGAAALGIELAPFKWAYVQGMGGIERTWNQEEISGPLKNAENKFLGYELNTWYLEGRLGLRKEHIEIFFSGALADDNRPFTLIEENSLGGSYHQSLDKLLQWGVLLFW